MCCLLVLDSVTSTRQWTRQLKIDANDRMTHDFFTCDSDAKVCLSVCATADSPFCIYKQEQALQSKFAANNQALTEKYQKLAEKYQDLSEKSWVWASDPLSKIDRARRLRERPCFSDASSTSNCMFICSCVHACACLRQHVLPLREHRPAAKTKLNSSELLPIFEDWHKRRVKPERRRGVESSKAPSPKRRRVLES